MMYQNESNIYNKRVNVAQQHNNLQLKLNVQEIMNYVPKKSNIYSEHVNVALQFNVHFTI